jgi:hypothetical protein
LKRVRINLPLSTVSADDVLLDKATTIALRGITKMKLKQDSWVDINEPDDDDGDEMSDIDFHENELDLGEEGERLHQLIHDCPKDAQVLEPAIQQKQKESFSAVENVLKKCTPKPLGWHINFKDKDIKKAAKIDGRDPKELKTAWEAYTVWRQELVNVEQSINQAIADKNISIGVGEERQHVGSVPVSLLGDLWSQNKMSGESALKEEALNERLEGLWLKHKFPRGWTKMPPVNDGAWPTQTQLEQRLQRQKRAELELEVLKTAAKPKAIGAGPSIGSNANNTLINAAPAATAPTRVTPNQQPFNLESLMLALSAANPGGAFPGSGQGLVVSRPPRTVLQLVSERSIAPNTVEPNHTDEGDLIVAWFQRDRVIKDDEDKNQITLQNFYFIVRRQRSDGRCFHEIMSEDAAGGRKVIGMVNKNLTPELCKQSDLTKLPSKRKIQGVEWGLNWVAARVKNNLVKRDVPTLVVSMWWREDDGKECCDFLKGAERPNERCVILTRGMFQRAVGPVQADKQIMNTLPHPNGGRWNDVAECIQDYTKEIPRGPRRDMSPALRALLQQQGQRN